MPCHAIGLNAVARGSQIIFEDLNSHSPYLTHADLFNNLTSFRSKLLILTSVPLSESQAEAFMTPLPASLKPLQSSLHGSAMSKGQSLRTKDACVTWDSLDIRGADSSQIIISTTIEITCHDNEKYEFDIWLNWSPTKSLADMSQFLHIQHSKYTRFFRDSSDFADSYADSLDLSQYSPPTQSSWVYDWTIPGDLSFDARYGYQISFTDGQNNTIASSPMFSAQDHSSMVPVSPSTAQQTTFLTSTIPASSGPTTDPVPTPSVGASPLPSPTDAGSSMGLSKGSLAGLAVGITALLVILLVGGSKFILTRKERRQRLEESPESSMLFWDKTPSASRLKIPIAEPHELDGSRCVLPSRDSKTVSSESSSNSDNQAHRLMSGCWPDRPWVPRPTHLPLS